MIAAATAVIVVLDGPSPTGQGALDAALVAVASAFVVWSAASAPWWAGVVAAACATALAPSAGWMLLGVATLFGGLAVGATRRSLPWSRAAVAAASTLVFAHLGNTQFFGFTSIVAVVVLGVLTVLGVRRRPRRDRKVLWIVLGGTAAAAVLAVVGFGLAAVSSRAAIEQGNRAARDGLQLLTDGDLRGASTAFSVAAERFADADTRLGRPWAQPARLVPVIAQHREAAATLVQSASDGSLQIARQLAVIDYDALRVSNGSIDLDAIRGLQQPVAVLQATLDGLVADIDSARSPWLLPELDDRMTELLGDLVARQDDIATARAAVDRAPEMLGAEGPRVYFVAFTTPAEARGLGGFMGNWAEITIDRGRLGVTGFGRTTDLARPTPKTLTPPDLGFLELYGPALWGSGSELLAGEDVWSNITVSPHFPSVAAMIAELYPQSGGDQLDGVVAMDVFAVARLMEITGDVELPDGTVVGAGNAAEFLLREQYLGDDQEERVDNLEFVARETTTRLLTSDLPAPPELGEMFGPLARENRLVAWMTRPEDDDVLRRVGMSGVLPALDGGDGVTISLNNAGANKIDAFLEGSATYEAEVNRPLGRVDGTVTITLRNTAPAFGLPDEVIGNLVELPRGTNRLQLLVHTALEVTSFRIDGEPAGFRRGVEQGYVVTSAFIDIPAGREVVVQLGTGGPIDPGAAYRVVTRAPATARPFPFDVTADLDNRDPPPAVVL